MKIYYAMSIRGEQSGDENINGLLIQHLKNFGEVLTEHFSNMKIDGSGETEISDKAIHDRDMKWLLSSDVIIAEISNTSFGVGYEIGRAVENNKKILCLRKKTDKRLSAMISGCDNLMLKEYSTPDEAINFINEFLKKQ